MGLLYANTCRRLVRLLGPAAVVVGCGGCQLIFPFSPMEREETDGRLLVDGAVDGTGDGSAMAADAASWTVLMQDDFSDGDAEYNHGIRLWEAWALKSSVPVEQGGQLSIVPPASDPTCSADPNCWAGLESAASYSFVNARVQVEAAKTLAAGDMGLYVSSTWGRYGIYVSNGATYCGFLPADATDWATHSTKCSSAAHRYWRMTHTSDPDSITFSVSEDYTGWEEITAITNTADLSQVWFNLEAGVWDSVPTPGEAVFDNFLAERPRTAGAP